MLGAMIDALFLGLTVGFFAAALGGAWCCGKIR
jgi:hypothetical protein